MRNEDDFRPVQQDEGRQKDERQREVANDFALFVDEALHSISPIPDQRRTLKSRDVTGFSRVHGRSIRFGERLWARICLQIHHAFAIRAWGTEINRARNMPTAEKEC